MQAVHAARVHASCVGALAIAAAGNNTAVAIADTDQTVSIGATVARARNTPKPELDKVPDNAKDQAAMTLRERLSAEDMQAGAAEAEQEAMECGQLLQTLMSEATVQVKVGGDGTVESVVVQPPVKGTPEAACIVTAVSKLTFAHSRDGGETTWKLKLY